MTAAPDFDDADRWPGPDLLYPGAADPLPGQEPLDLPGLEVPDAEAAALAEDAAYASAEAEPAPP